MQNEVPPFHPPAGNHDLPADADRHAGCAMKPVSNIEAARFLAALEALQREHGISLSHEDEQGSFLLRSFNPVYCTWVGQARIQGAWQ